MTQEPRQTHSDNDGGKNDKEIVHRHLHATHVDRTVDHRYVRQLARIRTPKEAKHILENQDERESQKQLE